MSSIDVEMSALLCNKDPPPKKKRKKKKKKEYQNKIRNFHFMSLIGVLGFYTPITAGRIYVVENAA